MKILSLSVLLLVLNGLMAQQPSEKDLKKHAERVAKSKAKGSVVRSLDTVFKAGEPYCLLKTTSKVLGTAMEQVATALNGEGRILISYEENPSQSGYLERYQIVDLGLMADLPVYVGKNTEDDIVKYDLFTPIGLNEKGAQMMAKANPSAAGILIQRQTAPATDEMVVRNRNAMIMVFGNEVKQDNKNIATINRTQEATGGTIVQRIYILNHLGKQIATAEGQGAVATGWVVISHADGKRHSVSTSPGTEVKDLCQFLVGRYYL